eukprot:2270966-Rhodomonas_salina.1
MLACSLPPALLSVLPQPFKPPFDPEPLPPRLHPPLHPPPFLPPPYPISCTPYAIPSRRIAAYAIPVPTSGHHTPSQYQT